MTGVLRAFPADFRVDEQLGFELSGDGEHLYLHIEKTGANSEWVAVALGRAAGIRRRDVGYAGRKDRQAVTRQWFSLWLPHGLATDPADWNIEGVRLLAQRWHSRKLRTGALSGNRFEIVLRELAGHDESFAERCASLGSQGVPNYFGQQRFGRDGRNLELARAMFAGQRRVRRNQRSMALSAARALIFNEVLAVRVEAGTWTTPQPGDCLNLAGSQSWFLYDGTDTSVLQRHAEGDLHVTGPLWGRGNQPTGLAVAAAEQEVASRFADLCSGLEKAGLKQERRALRVIPANCQFQLQDDILTIAFDLPPGCFATTVIANLVRYRDAAVSAP
ncbi:MAG: tRNA pseudouridine(13) synthase TruD [Gammaproteobacteria bacterium]|nr:tRNA pseudouridine(13) synthase TruD [Gammaproteobacteria bacterium]